MKAVIFDFDGTLADTFPFIFDIVTKLAPKYGYKPLSRAEIEELRNMSFRDIIKKYKVGPISLLRMTIDAHSANKERLPETKIFPGLPEVLRRLKTDGYLLAIISSNSKENIETVLKRDGLDGVFDGIYTSLNLFGKGAKLRQALRKGHFTPVETIYVGDEVRDYDAANEAGVKSISVTWGYNSQQILKQNGRVTVDTPSELAATIENLFK
jgi:phosphoglycolate phosphatase